MTSNDTGRTILYYPSISIPTGDWLRCALLYFDYISSIVPSRVRWDGEVDKPLVRLSDELEFLREEGVYRPISPEYLLFVQDNAERVGKFYDEFVSIIQHPSKRYRPFPKERRVSEKIRIHAGKLSYDMMHFLLHNGLASRPESEYGEWFDVEWEAGLLYMSMLAQHLAEINRDATVPGTDRAEYERIAYRSSSVSPDRFACLGVSLRGILPIPRGGVPLDDILDFRNKRRIELFHLRQEIDKFQDTLSRLESRTEIKDAIASHKEAIIRGVADVDAALADARIATISGTFKSLISLRSPALLSLVAGAAATPLGIPAAAVALPVLVGGGLIQVGCEWIQMRNKQRAIVRESPFAYLYHARRERLIA